MSMLSKPLFANLGDSSCPVCGDWQGKNQVVLAILTVLRQTGSFSFKNLDDFWEQFGSNLCFSCQAQLSSIKQNKQTAYQLLKEANKLDPDNKAIRDNLAAVEKML